MALTSERCFVSIFLWPTSCILLKQLFLQPSWARGIIVKYPPIFKTARVAKKIERIINTIASIWGENMLGYLSFICSSKLTVFLELRSRKTVHFLEQIMSADKYPSIFSRQMEAIVYISLIFNRHAYYVQLTAVISGSPLTSIIWPYLGLRFRAHQGHDIRKFKVALNPMYRIFLKLAKSCISSCSSKFYNKKKFHRADFEI